ncbi:MAG: hypothetical protein JJ975_05655, partial [Bacteroidia bacterium]|nr:hypothetical protein [Bacteroidia bacterium]
MSRRALILILLVSTWNLVRGVTTAPVLLRACLDNTTNVITIQYSSITDACGSFVDHQIFGSETGSSYQLMHTETDFSANTVQFVLPNGNPTWSFYFETRFLCDGSSIATSNTISIDITKPSETAIDSVSIDLTTQRLVVGWKKNTTPDTKGYRIYRSVNGVNSVIGDTASTHYIVHNQGIPLNSVITLATFDSCDLFSTISDGHRAMSLSSDLDTCTRTVNLSWSRYMGWSIDQQDLYYSTNGSAYTAMPLDAATASHSFPGLNFGDSVCFFVRARNLNPVQRTSSSNVTCAKLLKPVLPKLAYLSQVTVENNSTIKIEALVDNQGVSDSVILYRDASPPVRVGGRKLADGSNFYTWNDNKVSVSTRSETYFVRTFAPCLGGTLTSNSSPSIHLSIDDDELLVWNSYTGWEGDVLEYRVYGYDGSTWNIISSTSELNYQND